MISTFQNIFKVPDLKKKLVFTLFAVAVYRLGAHLPMPGINAQALGLLMQQTGCDTLFGRDALYLIFHYISTPRLSISTD